MEHEMKKLSLLITSTLIFFSASAQSLNWDDDATPLHRAEKALTDVIVHDVFSPPVASRIYAYSNIAAYEVLVKAHTDYASLQTQLPAFPVIPAPKNKISFSLASVYSFLITGKKMVYSDSVMEDSLNNILGWYKNKKIDASIYKNSLAYGNQVADSINVWMLKDHYKETRKLRRYTYLKQDGKWTPTPPGYFAAVEPYWNKIRCLVMDSANECMPEKVVTFSKDSVSNFYKQAHEVYTIGNRLSPEEKAIASFWDCNPFNLNTSGHLYFASKKISPGGHWINITALACKKTNRAIIQSSAAYTLVSIGLFDAFISCWDEKYRSNSIRPETYINKYIDESWRPLLQTPPFPEYTSGHSVVSTVAAIMLTNIFSDNFSFDDDSENEFNLPTRHFNSFIEAANEAAISRLYGGIHYRSSIIKGQDQGYKVAGQLLKRIHLHKE
jgi:hypothetical protein